MFHKGIILQHKDFTFRANFNFWMYYSLFKKKKNNFVVFSLSSKII